MLRWAFLFLGTLAVGGVRADPPIRVETSKLGVEDAPTVAPGVTELEVAWLTSWGSRQVGAGGRAVARGRFAAWGPAVRLTHGVAPRWDVALATSWVALRDRDHPARRGRGVGDLTVLAKWHAWQGEAVGLGCVFGATAPLGHPPDERRLGPGLGFWSLDQRLALTVVVNRCAVQADAGLRVAVGGRRQEHRALWDANAALGYQLTPWLQPEVELNYGHEVLRGAADPHLLRATFGVILNLSASVRLDLGIQRPLWGRAVDLSHTALANLSVSF